jgi:cysteine desulfuration protein SufE
MTPSISEIEENFLLLDEWEDRYRYLIELGRTLDPLPEAEHTEANKVRGCASQVWLSTARRGDPGDPVLTYVGDSDAHIVRGLIAIMLALVSGRRASRIVALDPLAVFARLGLAQHLTPQRSNGVRAMADRIRREAASAVHGSEPSVAPIVGR